MLNTARQLSRMLAQVNSPALGVCLDTNIMSANGDTVTIGSPSSPAASVWCGCATATGTAGGHGATAFCRWIDTSAS